MEHRKGKQMNMYRRFILSFLLVLCLPIICFSFVFTQYFGKVYRDKIVEHARNTLATAGMELVRITENLERVVADDTFDVSMARLILEKDYTGTQIKESLSAKRVNYLVLDEICYYNPVKPNVVYTSTGTYTLDIYAQVYAGLADSAVLLEQLRSVKGSDWFCWEPLDASGQSTKTSVQFVIRRHTDEWWIFTLNNTELKQLLFSEHALTVLESGEGDPIVWFGNREAKDSYRLSFAAANKVLRLSRYMTEAELFAEFSSYQNSFLLIVVALLIVGGILVLVLTYVNEHPIREMQRWVKEKIKSAPGNVEGMELFRYAIREMEGQVALSEKRQERDRLLLSMIYGHGCETESFRKAVTEAGLFREKSCFRVILGISEGPGEIRDKISWYLDTQEKGDIEIRWLDVANPEMIILIAGMKETEEKDLRKELLLIEDTVWGELGRSVCFCVGGSCRSFEKIHQSYAQALLCSRRYEETKGKDAARVLFYEQDLRLDKRFDYPDKKLGELEEALLEANTDKVQAVTDDLIDILRREDDSRFASVSLYFDVLNAYYKAQVRLDIDGDFAMYEVGLLEAKDHYSAIQMILSVREQYFAFVKKAQSQIKYEKAADRYLEQAESHKDRLEKDELVLRVVEYLEENVEPCDMSVSMVADNFGLSISQLSQRFKKTMGITMSDYIIEKRLAYACGLLLETEYSVTEIALLTGYSHPVSFIRRFKRQYGVTPMEYRAKEET